MYEHQNYPEGVDCVWAAGDENGMAGAFITGGIGPIPLEVLQLDRLNIFEVEENLLQLPIVTTAEIISNAPITDSYAALAARGFYVFDWLDVERALVERSNRYELVARPANHKKINDLLRIGSDKSIASQSIKSNFLKASAVSEHDIGVTIVRSAQGGVGGLVK